MGGVGRLSLVEVVALLAVAGAVGAAVTAWRAARQARRAADASAEWARGLHEGLRRAIHDMNNPLAAASINAELLRLSCRENESARRLAESIQDQIQRAKDAVAHLNDLGKPAA
ncbi:MAG TPA: histidine kinase dimerization/phospho-acceptor domain-containing protein [Candidatus Sulfotelmatobacter sp.]|nr:histidine kinase dimerization/phospho-acceptor domain-containing protein [Candidatus Sulfotelmatobacter sp.]